jgi:PAS domain S-box-containing protein
MFMTGKRHFEEIKKLLGESKTYYLIAVDMNANYSYLNRHYAEIFKPIHGDLLGKHYALTIHPDDQLTCETVSELAFKHVDAVFPATLRKHDGKGDFIITRWEYKAMFDDSGAPDGIFCVGHDITDLVQASGELNQIKFNHSHLIRKHVANLMGLGKLINDATEPDDIKDAAKMIFQSATDLDQVVREIHK